MSQKIYIYFSPILPPGFSERSQNVVAKWFLGWQYEPVGHLDPQKIISTSRRGFVTPQSDIYDPQKMTVIPWLLIWSLKLRHLQARVKLNQQRVQHFPDKTHIGFIDFTFLETKQNLTGSLKESFKQFQSQRKTSAVLLWKNPEENITPPLTTL